MSKLLRILFAEDSEDDVELTVNELLRGGFAPHVRRVENEFAMRKALREAEWDLVISDYRMPCFTAARALECMRESHFDLPFIILSGVVNAEDAVCLLKNGAHDFINKYELARLVPAVQRELREAVERAERKRAEERVRILSLAVEQSPVSVVITDMHGVISYVNPKFEEITGYTLDEALGQKLDFTLYQRESGAIFESAWQSIMAGENWHGILCNLRKDGQIFWENANISPLKNETGKTSHFIAVKEDITVRRNYEEQLLRKAHYDDLTGLANRSLMLEHLDHAIAAARNERHQGALLCIDLDHFKDVNDTLGHGVGDELLIKAVARLSQCVRKGDTLARMGGDEFVIILPTICGVDTARKISTKIVELFEEPFEMHGQSRLVTASIGIAVFPNDGHNHQTLLTNADLAMYRAKELGRNQYHFFTEAINRRLKERVILEARLREVLINDELTLHYQPIIDIKHRRICGYEALLRWPQPDGQTSMPSEFITVAENTGLILDIGRWVIASACRDLSEALENNFANIKMAINVSPRQLHADDFFFYVKQQLELHKIKPSQLELEITENVLIEEHAATNRNLSALAKLGVRLAIDDFGTGYSALSYLQKYPFKTLKIDRSFIQDVPHNSHSAKLVQTIIKMAHNLDLSVIAEGVETQEQLDFLSTPECACDFVQGYYFGKPRTINHFFPHNPEPLLQQIQSAAIY